MLKVSMIVRRQAQIYSLVSLNLFMSRSLLTPLLMSLALYIFALSFLVLDFVGCFSLVYILRT